MSSAASATAADFSEAVGRTERLSARILPERASALSAALDLTAAPGEGAPLPAGWHWMFFNPFAPRAQLGEDGHPRRGGFLPDVGLPRRMWAGGRLSYLSPLPVGADAERESEILSVTAKSGRAGRLVFVTVRHRISQGGALCIEEEQDIVYREAPTPDAPKPKPAPAPEGADRSVAVSPDPVLLFRYSALTDNGHRIHYDRPYATGEEDYPGLVVHGPLTATLLQGFAASARPGARLALFEFRGIAPLFVDRPFRLESKPGAEGNALDLWARGPDGELAMKASAVFAD